MDGRYVQENWSAVSVKVELVVEEEELVLLAPWSYCHREPVHFPVLCTKIIRPSFLMKKRKMMMLMKMMMESRYLMMCCCVQVVNASLTERAYGVGLQPLQKQKLKEEDETREGRKDRYLSDARRAEQVRTAVH